MRAAPRLWATPRVLFQRLYRDCVNGFTVPYKDLRAAAKRVEQILTMDSWERESLWKESHEESLKYDWDKTAAEYYGVLRSLF